MFCLGRRKLFAKKDNKLRSLGRRKRIFVAQLVDAAINNPQVLNARALLSRFSNHDIEWIVPHYGEPDPVLLNRENIQLVRLWRRRFWQWHKFLLYQYQIDAIFYPGAYWFDDLAMQLRKICGRKVPAIATLEGLIGDEERENLYSQRVGHPVYCQRIEPKLLQRVDRVLREADHVIAISPFLAKMAKNICDDKFSILPLGIDGNIFHPIGRSCPARFTVVGAGRMYDNKRPQLFLKMARQWPEVEFIWFGDGELRHSLLEEIAGAGLTNVSFPGAIPNRQIAEEFRRSSLFVLPSHSEGVPKVTQEAAACGLPVINFGFYEAPSVVDGENGYVVWNDDELFARVGELIADPEKARTMGARGAEMAKGWEWDLVVRQWEAKLIEILS